MGSMVGRRGSAPHRPGGSKSTVEVGTPEQHVAPQRLSATSSDVRSLVPLDLLPNRPGGLHLRVRSRSPTKCRTVAADRASVDLWTGGNA